jgi:hypothetical protein
MIAHFVINGSSVLSLEAQKLVGIYGGSSKQLALQTQLTPETLMMVAAVYGVVAVGTTALAIGVYIWIAKHCGRENHLRAVFTIRKGEDKFNLRKAISFWLIASIVISIGFMGFSEYMNGRETQPKTIEQDIDGVPDSTLQVLFHE